MSAQAMQTGSDAQVVWIEAEGRTEKDVLIDHLREELRIANVHLESARAERLWSFDWMDDNGDEHTYLVVGRTEKLARERLLELMGIEIPSDAEVQQTNAFGVSDYSEPAKDMTRRQIVRA